MKKNKQETPEQLCRDIQQGLDNILELMAWTVRADARFSVGQRVEFSRFADKRGGLTRPKWRCAQGDRKGNRPPKY